MFWLLTRLTTVIAFLSYPAQAQPSWVGDFETNDLSQWSGRQAKQGALDDRLRIIPAPLGKSQFALQVRVEDNDEPVVNQAGHTITGGWRAEVVHKPDETEGTLAQYSWSTMFDHSYPSAAETSGIFQVVTQWHHCDGCQGASPPVEFIVREDRIWLHVNKPEGGGPVKRWDITPIQRGNWHDFRLLIKWTHDKRQGLIELDHNGSPAVRDLGTQTLFPHSSGGLGSVYLKLGLYRKAAVVGKPFVLFHDEMKTDYLRCGNCTLGGSPIGGPHCCIPGMCHFHHDCRVPFEVP